MVSLIGGLLTFTLGTGLVTWGAAVRGAMEHDGTLRGAGRLPQGASQEAS